MAHFLQNYNFHVQELILSILIEVDNLGRWDYIGYC